MTTCSTAQTARMRETLRRMFTNHPDFRVAEVGRGLAFQVTGPANCAVRLEQLVYLGIGSPLDTGYTVKHRADGAGVILHNWSEQLDRKWRRIWT